MQTDSGPGSRERLAACERASHAIHIRPHSVGAVVARGERWVLILPADSGEVMHWPWPVGYRDTGLLSVPPLSAGPSDALHWARLGNGQGGFSAPLPLYAALPLPVLPGPRPAPDRLDRDRTPVPVRLHPATA
ncbi:hypothetical protein ACFXJO_16685 [Streptomyces lavendulae]|uniref:hypothetical protein n=1 Tax=Streptomyces lavendulae TaxID=1914 RepID=UPI003686AED0